MASTTKPTKDKPHTGTPRLIPRPTAASTARAARNATNRNIVASLFKHSPTRNPPNPIPSKPSNVTVNKSRTLHSTDSKPEVKQSEQICKPASVEVIEINNELQAPESNIDQYLIPDNLPDPMYEQNYQRSVVTLEDIKENKTLESCTDDDTQDDEINSYQSQPEQQIKAPSRPLTPIRSSRPPTPKSLPRSRPQTPQIPQNRPSTPVQRVTCTMSRPNTPQKPPKTPTSSRPTTPAMNKSQDERDVKTAFATKQKQFQRMKKELDIKQRQILEMFESLQIMRERMSRDGVSASGEGRLNELIMINVADWTSDEISRMCSDVISETPDKDAVDVFNTTVPIDERTLSELETEVSSVPACFAELCLKAFTARQELIDWVKDLFESNMIKQDNGSGECLERIAHFNAQGLQLCDALRDLKNKADGVVCTLSQLSRRACRERGALLAVGESLVREIAKLRQEVHDTRTITGGGASATNQPDSKALDKMRNELEEERASNAALKDKLNTTEVHLRQTRARINKMDRQLREAETTITSLTSTVKTMEDQSRQKEVQLEAKARKLRDSLKTGELSREQLVQQRDLLQTEIKQLKEQIETMQSEHNTTVQELTNDLKQVKTSLQEQIKITQMENENRKTVEQLLAQSQNTVEELKAKLDKLEKCVTTTDLPTEREIDLWAELQATKETLRITEDEVTACKREKTRFIETLTKIAENDNKVGMQQKLAAELLSKEEIIGKMQMQIRDLTKNMKLNEQKVIQYEQYVQGLQAHNRAIANCEEIPDGIAYQELQHEIMHLKMNLLETEHRNEELTEMLMQKEQQIEQQDKTSRAQARVIKVREELINMLKNKETEQSRELTALQQDLEHRMKIVDEVNKQIASKAGEIQELFSTLENKQQQIHRLEKIVLALEEQQRRAQAQRTRHEEKIAALEHELAAGNRRERFLFL